ncbi:MAG TPA: hypothetical protein VHA56_20620 [Mucilaginibacter sp.]|nr:hypothetical protein [Mucilaginibacter sp.]
MAIFSDLTSSYKILDFSATHNQLLIRSVRNIHRNYNIDIFFKSVSFLILPTTIEGIEIDLLQNTQNRELFSNNYTFDIKYSKIFSLKDSASNFYFINASAFGVFHNSLDILESSIGRYDYGLLGESIFWYK